MANRGQSSLILLSITLLFSSAVLAWDKDAPLFDAHIHYSHDVWQAIPPEKAIRKLRDAGISHALVSGSGVDAEQKLYRVAPDMVIPSLRPYRVRADVDGWVDDVDVIPYLQKQLAANHYAAIGEFHVTGAEADYPVVQKLVALAKKYNLILHAHADADAIKRLYKQYPQARILWAHAGFEYAATVDELMDSHDNLWADLSFRREIYTNRQFLRTWKDLLVKHSDRFMLGVDTYTPQRWLQIKEVMAWQHALLDALPKQVAQRIAFENAKEKIIQPFQDRSE